LAEYIVKRLFLFVPTVILATMVVFTLMWIVPGDAAYAILAGDEGSYVDPDELTALREKLGIDRPIYVQYGDWLWNTLRGDFGEMTLARYPVMNELKRRFPVTMELAFMGVVMAFVVAVPLGAISAVKQDTWVDHISRVFTTTGIAMPSFWLAILVILFLEKVIGWLPPIRYAVLWDDPFLNLQQMVFPAIAIAFHDLAFIARLTRSSMLEVMHEDYVRTARAKGLAEWIVVGRHAMKNAMLPVLTASGYLFARLLGGTIIVETIFLVPGLGNLLVDSVAERDFITIQAIVVVVGVVVLIINLLVDMAYAWVDPRVRYA
jgi:peptide/nickel transport system permease protein